MLNKYKISPRAQRKGKNLHPRLPKIASFGGNFLIVVVTPQSSGDLGAESGQEGDRTRTGG
jgi:hypothetical protein